MCTKNKKTSIVLAFLIYLVCFGGINTVNAAFIDVDWQTPGDAAITFHTDTNLAWLDLSVTASMSVNEVLTSLNPGGQFEGWRYATQEDVETLKVAYLGTAYWSCYNCAVQMDEQVFDGRNWGVYSRQQDGFDYWQATLEPFENGNIWDDIPVFSLDDSTAHFLIQEIATPVPIPPAVILFGSGLFGLLGFRRLKNI